MAIFTVQQTEKLVFKFEADVMQDVDITNMYIFYIGTREGDILKATPAQISFV